MRKDLVYLENLNEKLGMTEVFQSIQGEGVDIGRPALFLRAAICTLRCTWCDTKYSWQIPSEKMVKSIPEWIHYIRALPDIEQYGYLVLTGGEPMAQKQQLARLVLETNSMWEKVTIETSGTILPEYEEFPKFVHYSLSPKLQSAYRGQDSSKYSVDYKSWLKIALRHEVTFKFVISDQEDIEEMIDIVENRIGDRFLKKSFIIVQPNSEPFFEEELDIPKKIVFNHRTYFQKMKELAEWFKDNGKHYVAVLPQLHVAYWGGDSGY